MVVRADRFPVSQNHPLQRAARLRGGPMAIAAGHDRHHQAIPGSRLGYQRGPSSRGMSLWNARPSTAASRSPRATRSTSGDHCWRPTDADPATQVALDWAPRVDDEIRDATDTTGSGLMKRPSAPDSIVRPTDSPRCSPIQDRNISTERGDVQHRLSRGSAGKRSTTGCRRTRLQG